LYGKAEFRSGFSEPEDLSTTPSTPSSVPVPASTPNPVGDTTPEPQVSTEGYGILQKGLFLAVILGCIVVYLRMAGKKNKRYREKSLV